MKNVRLNYYNHHRRRHSLAPSKYISVKYPINNLLCWNHTKYSITFQAIMYCVIIHRGTIQIRWLSSHIIWDMDITEFGLKIHWNDRPKQNSTICYICKIYQRKTNSILYFMIAFMNVCSFKWLTNKNGFSNQSFLLCSFPEITIVEQLVRHTY